MDTQIAANLNIREIEKSMNDYDVIVIGGGPAGCYAALSAATAGCSVALFEEHRSIGWPRHDPGWLMESDFATSLLSSMGKELVWTKVREFRVSVAESGDLLEKSISGGYLIRRDHLEKEIATAAVKAGASLYLKTKVMKLVRSNRTVVGIETNSDIIPRANGHIFICADGIRSPNTGFAAIEGLCEVGEVRSGTSYLLTNADISAGIIDHQLSSNPLLNYMCLWGHRDGLCYFGLPTSTGYDEMKRRRDNVVSRKIQNAYPLEISGYATGSSGKSGKYFAKMVQDNIIFIGNASGGSGNIHGMIQGQFAAAVAASALKDNDVTEARLSEYQELVLKTLGKAPFFWISAKEDFGSFDNWFREFREATKGLNATEFTGDA
ncbi:FAD-dependent oxidoreductase [Chloroflexota bacterium]